MSAKASGYAKELLICPNGELISAREKLVLMVLADSHQVKAGRFTFPSVDTIASEARCDRRSCQRYLGALERKGVIRRLRPANQGAGMMTFYFFPAIESIPEGWQSAALFFEPRAAEGRVEGRQKGGKRAATAQLSLVERAREREQEPEQQQIPPSPQASPGGADGSMPVSSVGDALDRWMDEQSFTAKRLRRRLRAVWAARVRSAVKVGDEVAAEMADAWKRYGSQGRRLFRHVSAAEFFEGGFWLNANSWHWNTEFLNREDRMAEAKAGSR